MPQKSIKRKILPRIFADKRGLIFCLLVCVVGCKNVVDRQNVTPRVLRDVPARNLAYRLAPDVTPPSTEIDDTLDKFAAVANDFSTKRRDEALLRTVVSPDSRRVLALYGTVDDPGSTFRIDLYNSDGQFLRNLIPPDLACVFPETVTWSPDGSFINFIAHKRVMASPSPTPLSEPEPAPSGSPGVPAPVPSIAPLFPSVASFSTEQIYICNRDGYDLKPLTSRDGLIYFYFVWAPDNHAMVALACKEDEWNARERQYKLPAGRPRLIEPDGTERLLDDALNDALPVWSPDASKIATAFETDVAIYDSGGKTPTQGRVPLSEQLLAASVAYDQKATVTKANTNAQQASSTPSAPASFNPIVRLDWRRPETLYFQTAYVRVMPNETINTFQRWHVLNISPQAAVLK